MKLHDTAYEYSNTIRTSLSNGKLQMSQGLKLKCEFLPRFLLFLIAICLKSHLNSMSGHFSKLFPKF